MNQLGGGCHKNVASGRCKKYDGEDADDCMVGPLGRCRSGKRLAKAYAVKLPATPAQLAALTKARAVRAANVARRKSKAVMRQVGGASDEDIAVWSALLLDNWRTSTAQAHQIEAAIILTNQLEQAGVEGTPVLRLHRAMMNLNRVLNSAGITGGRLMAALRAVEDIAEELGETVDEWPIIEDAEEELGNLL